MERWFEVRSEVFVLGADGTPIGKLRPGRRYRATAVDHEHVTVPGPGGTVGAVDRAAVIFEPEPAAAPEPAPEPAPQPASTTTVPVQAAPPPPQQVAPVDPRAAGEPPSDLDDPPRRRSRSRWIVLGAVATVLVLLAVVAMVVLNAGGDDASCGLSGEPALLARRDASDVVGMRGADAGNTNDFGQNLAPTGGEMFERWCVETGDVQQHAFSVAGQFLWYDDGEQIASVDLRTGRPVSEIPSRGDLASDGRSLFVAGDHIAAYDLESPSRAKWIAGDDAPVVVEGINHADPVLAGDTLLVVARPLEEPELWALDTSTGEVQWAVPLPVEPGTVRGRVAVDGGTVYVPTSDAVITVDLSDGAVGSQWPADFLFTGLAAQDRYVYADGPGDGEALEYVGDGLRSVRSRDVPVLATEHGLVLSFWTRDESSLSAYDLSSGERVWEHEAAIPDDGREGVAASRPAVADDVAYITVESTVFAVDLDSGSTRWSYDAGVGITDQLVVANGLLIFRADDGTIRAIGDRPE